MFTDEDVAKWEKELERYDGQGIFRIYGHEMTALLARLEASEKIVNSLLEAGLYLDDEEPINAWRASAGK